MTVEESTAPGDRYHYRSVATRLQPWCLTTTKRGGSSSSGASHLLRRRYRQRGTRRKEVGEGYEEGGRDKERRYHRS